MDTATRDRVRAHTAPAINRRIDEEAERRIEALIDADAAEIAARIDALDREWDTERILETNAAALALTGLLLGLLKSRRWLIVPGIVLPFLLQHAIQGWCPPLPVLRRLGVRTQKEIEAEKCALKALRGDFREVSRKLG